MWFRTGSSRSIAPDGSLLPGMDFLKAIALSNHCYYDKEEFTKRAAYFKFDVIELIEDKSVDTQLFVGLSRSSRILYIAFRGTSSDKDIAIDKKGKLVPLNVVDPKQPKEVIKVVEGFNMQLSAVNEKIFHLIDEHAADFDELFLTGHSLGAALATIFVPVYHHHNKSLVTPLSKTIKCITYGSPRVGNRAFTKFYSSCIDPANHWRIYNYRDLISKISIPSMGFYHVPGNTVRIKGNWSNYRYVLVQEDSGAIPIPIWDMALGHCTRRYMRSISSFFPELKEDHAELVKYF